MRKRGKERVALGRLGVHEAVHLLVEANTLEEQLTAQLAVATRKREAPRLECLLGESTPRRRVLDQRHDAHDVLGHKHGIARRWRVLGALPARRRRQFDWRLHGIVAHGELHARLEAQGTQRRPLAQLLCKERGGQLVPETRTHLVAHLVRELCRGQLGPCAALCAGRHSSGGRCIDARAEQAVEDVRNARGGRGRARGSQVRTQPMLGRTHDHFVQDDSAERIEESFVAGAQLGGHNLVQLARLRRLTQVCEAAEVPHVDATRVHLLRQRDAIDGRREARGYIAHEAHEDLATQIVRRGAHGLHARLLLVCNGCDELRRAVPRSAELGKRIRVE